MPYFDKIVTGEWVDPITRLPNQEFAQHVMNELKNSAEVFHILHIKLKFNSESEDVRSFVLSRVSSVIKHSVRIPKDFVCKVGSNDFCIVVHGVAENELKRISNRIKDSLHYLLLTYGSERIQIDCEIDITTIGGA